MSQSITIDFMQLAENAVNDVIAKKSKRKKMSDTYRNTLSKDGCFSPRISPKTTRRLIRYCESQNFNKSKFVEDCINERLDVLERETLNSMPKEMLVELLLSKKEWK